MSNASKPSVPTPLECFATLRDAVAALGPHAVVTLVMAGRGQEGERRFQGGLPAWARVARADEVHAGDPRRRASAASRSGA